MSDKNVILAIWRKTSPMSYASMNSLRVLARELASHQSTRHHMVQSFRYTVWE
jgi:hypothetical protein